MKKLNQKSPPKSAAPSPVIVPPKGQQRRELAVLFLLVTILTGIILWTPLHRGEIACNLTATMTMEPWASFPQFDGKAKEFNTRPWIGTITLPWDPESLFYPWMRFTEKELMRGVLPLWFPYAACGTPLIGTQESAIFNPYQILFYLFHSLYIYNLIAFLKLLVVGLFPYLFARRVGLSREASLFAGGIALFCSSYYELWDHPHSMALAFLPALLWVTEKFIQEKSGRASLDLVAVVAVSTLCGAPEISIDTFIQAGFYVLIRLWQDPTLNTRQKFRWAAQYAGTAALAAPLVAVHLLPSSEYFSRSYCLAWRLPKGFSWEVMSNFTRPFTGDDLLPTCLAFAFSYAAWRLCVRVRRAWNANGIGTNFVNLCLLAGSLTLALSFFLILGMDESLFYRFTPYFVHNYGTASLGIVLPLCLALFALLDPEMPPALKALRPGWLFAFALSGKIFGLSHLIGSSPFLKLMTPEFRIYVVPVLSVWWSAWGIERLLKATSLPVATRLKEAALLVAAVVLLPVCFISAFQLKPWLADHIDVGLHPYGQINSGAAHLGGIMGAGKQQVISEVNDIRGWFVSTLPISKILVGFAPDKFSPAQLTLSGERTYFKGSVTGSGLPVAILITNEGKQVALRASELTYDPIPNLRWTFGLWFLAVALLLACWIFTPAPMWTLGWISLVSLCEALIFAWHFVPSIPVNYVVPPNPVTQLLQEDHSLFRTFSSEGDGFWRAASASLFNIQEFRTSDAIDPMRYMFFQRLVLSSLADKDPQIQAEGYRLLGLANVKYYYVAGAHSLPLDHFELVYQASNFKVYRNKHVLARALVFENAEVIPDQGLDDYVDGQPTLERVRAWVQAHPQDFENTLLLHATTETSLLKSGSIKRSPPREAKIVHYEPTRLEVDAEAPHGGYLFVSDTYFPGWRVWVDGSEQQILPAWLGFRAVQLNPGRHHVRFEYHPHSFLTGLIITVLGVLLWLYFYLRYALREESGPYLKVGEHVLEGLILVDILFWTLWTLFHRPPL